MLTEDKGLDDPPTDRVVDNNGFAACEECGCLLCVYETPATNPHLVITHMILSNAAPADDVIRVVCAGCGHSLFERRAQGGENVL